MEKLRAFLLCFVTVTTGIVIIGAFTYAAAPAALTPDTLWQILLAAALCALATALFFPSEMAKKLRVWVGTILHFVSLCIIMVLCGRWFGWIDETLTGAAVMVGYVVIVYVFTTAIGYITVKRDADAINRQLREKYPKEPEEK